MRIKIAVPEAHVSPDVVDASLEAVTRLDQQMIESGQVPTFDSQSKVKWQPEPPGDEHFDNAATVLARGWGDCDDLAPWHAAGLRATGRDPGATARVVPSGPNTYHAIVQRSDGSIDDPSVKAGMTPLRRSSVVGGGYVAGYEEGGQLLATCGPLSTRCGPAWAVRQLGPQDWEARVDAPIAGSRVHRVHVRRYTRKFPRHRRVHGGYVAGGYVVGSCGAVPYALANIARAPDPHVALHTAVIGALLCGVCSPEDQARLSRFLPR